VSEEPDAADAARVEAARRRRRAEIFGDVLPASTGDDVDPDGRGDGARDNDEWLRRNVPPHHG
jgi:hypothetical protein